MKTLKKVFNWFKLYVSLGFIGGGVALLISEHKQFNSPFLVWAPILLFGIILFAIGFLLLVWFIRARKKYKQVVSDNLKVESSFYNNYPNLCAFLEGWSFNGFGTKYFTFSNKQADNSVYATKWIIMVFFPIIPLYQERVKVVSETDRIFIPLFFSTSKIEYRVIERVGLTKNLIRLTYGYYFLFFLPLLVLPIVLIIANIDYLCTILPGSNFWWLLLLYFFWGVFIVFITELFNKYFFLKMKFKSQS